MERLVGYIGALGVDAVGVHLPDIPAFAAVRAACEAAGVDAVSLEVGPAVVVTADGVIDNGVVRCLKDEVDAAVPDAKRVIVIRHLGTVPLAPTLDAYLDVEMIAGRDVWLDDLPAGGYVGASG